MTDNDSNQTTHGLNPGYLDDVDVTPYKTLQEERDDRPDLCHKCGRCCRTALTGMAHDDLKRRAEEGDEGANSLLDIQRAGS